MFFHHSCGDFGLCFVPITPEGFGLGPYPHAISPDGKQMAVIGSNGIALVSTETSCPIWHLNLQTGARSAWKSVAPIDIAGADGVSCPRVAADEEHYFFGYVRDLSNLFLVEHLK